MTLVLAGGARGAPVVTVPAGISADISGVGVGISPSTSVVDVSSSGTSVVGVTSSGTSGESVKRGVPRDRWIVLVVGGRVVVDVPEFVFVVTGQVVVYRELVSTVVEPIGHLVTVGWHAVIVYVFWV